MGANDPEFLRKLLATFSVEAAEHMAALSSGLVELENAPSPERRMAIVEATFREAHSLKGAARAVSLNKVELICGSLETAFSELKTSGAVPSAERLDQLHKMVSAASAEVDLAVTGRRAGPQSVPGPPTPETGNTQPGTEALAAAAGETPGRSETVRASTAKLESLLRLAEELVTSRAVAAHRSAQIREVAAMVSNWEREWRKAGPLFRPQRQPVSDAARFAALADLADRNERALASIRGRIAAVAQGLESDRRSLDRGVTELLESVKSVSMMPFSAILTGFPKIVRDLCRDSGKDAEFTVEGGDIEADRRVLEQIKDPLIHLIRNSVDHGIETPSDRERLRKPRLARLSIAVSLRDGKGVVVTISDDGRGIDLDRVRAAALKLDPESAQATPDDQQALSLVFHSGLSTSPSVTEVSGHGLGLAIVREKVEKIGGSVSVESRPGRGVTFRLALPLTLSNFQGLLVRVGEQLFVVPGGHVARVFRVAEGQIRRVENREIVEVDRKPVSLVRLADLLGIHAAGEDVQPRRKLPAVALESGGRQIVAVVDEVLRVQEFLVKGLGKQLSRVRNISGMTLLPTGKIALVLNVADLIQAGSRMAGGAPARDTAREKKSVLVVDDSITTRTLLKAMLESAGYQVRTAVDGIDALVSIEESAVDLVVTDIDMPRLGGFDLTRRIRAHPAHSDLPVVIVTALESSSDRERGMEAGANGYIVKSSFDESNLLQVVGRLI